MRIIVSGGGTGGHIYPALALIERLKQVEPDTQVLYVGTDRGLENKIVPAAGLELKVLHTQGFKRSLSLENFKTAYLFLKAVHDAKKIIKEFKPDVVLGTGGYVSGAVLYAAAKLHVPTVIHEQNSVVGITNKFLSRYVDEIAIAFDAARDQFPAAKVTMCGNPRAQQAAANANSDFSWTSYGLSDDKPVLMIIGGSLGSAVINQSVREALPKLLDDFQIVHICGKDKIDNLLLKTPGYKQFEYVKDDLKDIFAMADIVVSRAGANAICELLALKKPNLLIPLSAGASRGDQILNARSFEAQGFSMVIDEDYLSPGLLIEKVHALYGSRQTYIDAMGKSRQTNAIPSILEIINEITG